MLLSRLVGRVESIAFALPKASISATI